MRTGVGARYASTSHILRPVSIKRARAAPTRQPAVTCVKVCRRRRIRDQPTRGTSKVMVIGHTLVPPTATAVAAAADMVAL